MRTVPVTGQGHVPASEVTRFERLLGEQRTLGDVLAWARSQQPPRAVTEIITQDEYTHDVVVGYDERVYLVFDTT